MTSYLAFAAHVLQLSGKKWSLLTSKATEANPWLPAYCKACTCFETLNIFFASYKRPHPGAYNSLYRPTSSYVIPSDYMKECV